VRKLSRSLILVSLPLLLLLSGSGASAAARKHRATKLSSSSKHSSSKGKHASSKKAAGQHVIDDQRATEIQTSLIKAGYLSGEPSGHWDAASQAAMIKLQSDNGWQTKLVPDARALIKLGLGPENAAEAAATNPSTASNASPSAGQKP